VKEYRKTRQEALVEKTISEIYSEYEEKVANMTGADLQLDTLGALPPVRADFEAAWSAGVRQPFWSGGEKVRQDLVQVYGNALTYSNTIKVFSDLPLIRETAVQEADGEFDWRTFGEVKYGHVDGTDSESVDHGIHRTALGGPWPSGLRVAEKTWERCGGVVVEPSEFA